MQSFQISRHDSTQETIPENKLTGFAAAIGLAGSQYLARPVVLPSRKTRKAPWLVNANRAIRAVLIALCGLSILGYGLDVAASSDVGKLQDQARRLSEQNTELSAQLLRVISFQGIQDSVLGQSGLRVPEKVFIVKEVQSDLMVPFQQHKHHLPLIAGY